MTVQIKHGTFGFNDGKKIISYSAADGPIDFDEAIEGRLVSRGIAEYVEEKAETKAANSEKKAKASKKQQTAEAETAEVQDGALPEYNSKMDYFTLQKVARAYGINPKDLKKKADILAALDELKDASEENTADEEAEDADDVPQLSAADPV